MQNENQSFIDVIIETCTELSDAIRNYCDGRNCGNCDFNNTHKLCSYKSNLLMLLNGYRMATTDPSEKAQLDAYLKENYPSFLVELYKEN